MTNKLALMLPLLLLSLVSCGSTNNGSDKNPTGGYKYNLVSYAEIETHIENNLSRKDYPLFESAVVVKKGISYDASGSGSGLSYIVSEMNSYEYVPQPNTYLIASQTSFSSLRLSNISTTSGSYTYEYFIASSGWSLRKATYSFAHAGETITRINENYYDKYNWLQGSIVSFEGTTNFYDTTATCSSLYHTIVLYKNFY